MYPALYSAVSEDEAAPLDKSVHTFIAISTSDIATFDRFLTTSFKLLVNIAYGGPITEENQKRGGLFDLGNNNLDSSIYASRNVATLTRRAKKNHPSASKEIKLYHGASVEAAASIVKGGASTIRTNDKAGEFTAPGYSGFYMTDSQTAAAQYACNYLDHKGTVGVIGNFMIQNTGTNPADLGIKPPGFKSSDYDMISGPHAVAGIKDLTSNFWQYAITRPNGIKGLKALSHKDFDCSKVPKGEIPYDNDFKNV
ncbi:hypothetical protein GALMADRAFT_214187 [Galerina marginata CBS 339.88]|uniref:Uncharacterized protein n=1 Tax=Galerina marginata (strain CBS 339.88) TaxID=685588 RepID=A0A067SL82_GALM3|nr:hypothetical protein GALMADRAFT_214187 [Galerina marginata CBS 339.88]